MELENQLAALKQLELLAANQIAHPVNTEPKSGVSCAHLILKSPLAINFWNYPISNKPGPSIDFVDTCPWDIERVDMDSVLAEEPKKPVVMLYKYAACSSTVVLNPQRYPGDNFFAQSVWWWGMGRTGSCHMFFVYIL